MRDIEIRMLQVLSLEQSRAVSQSQKVKRFLARLAAMDGIDGISVKAAIIHKVFFFGDAVGYVIAEGLATNADGSAIPGLALVRGDSVAMLPILKTPDGGEYTVLVRQRRLPVGAVDYEEIPAGMIDEGVFKSKALEELSEEIGEDFEVGQEDLVLLENYEPSPGGCDESVAIFLAEKEVTLEYVNSLQGRSTGNRKEGERITLEVIPLADLAIRALSDGKSRLAYYSYMAHKGRVARPAHEQSVDVSTSGLRR